MFSLGEGDWGDWSDKRSLVKQSESTSRDNEQLYVCHCLASFSFVMCLATRAFLLGRILVMFFCTRAAQDQKSRVAPASGVSDRQLFPSRPELCGKPLSCCVAGQLFAFRHSMDRMFFCMFLVDKNNPTSNCIIIIFMQFSNTVS